MSPFGLVIIRCVNPVPGPVVQVCTRLPATRRSFVPVVTSAGVLLALVVPVAAAVASTGSVRWTPLYWAMRMSG